MDDGGRVHVVMFPWLAMGHLIPFLELSKCLSQKGHHVSFLSTPRNIDRLPKIPQDLSLLINLVNLPLPHEDNLPENAEATMDLPPNKVCYLKKAFDGLEGQVANFLENSVPDWIIYDFASHWLPSLATKLHVPCAYFCLFNASSICFFGPPSSRMGHDDKDSWKAMEDLTVVPKWIPFSSGVFLRLHEVLRIVNNIGENVSGVSDLYRYTSAIQSCDIVLIRSCTEFEPDWLRLLEDDIFKKRVIPVGLLPPTVQERKGDEVEKCEKISEWLDKQRPASVVYVALGSEVNLGQEEVTELALGLEMSELPFFWVLRSPPGSVEADSVVLPAGFEDRIGARGIVCKDWAPQISILAHPSTGSFLTHCGWNSIIEALGFGRVLIMLPFMAEQGLNARVLEGRKIGFEIPRNERDGSFTRDDVAKSLRMVMVDEEGESLRITAREMRDIFYDKDLHDRYINKFIEYLQDHVCKETHE